MARKKSSRHPPRRGKAAQKDWLSDKRQHPDQAVARTGDSEIAHVAEAPETAGRRMRAEVDFCAYYEAQQLFGIDCPTTAAAEYEAFWRSMRSPLPVTVRVSRRCCEELASRTEARLASMGWMRRREFDRAGMSVWEIDDDRFTDSPSVKPWADLQNRWGSLNFQELVSMLPAMILAPSPHHICLDVCAAPGNKSLQLIEALEQNSSPGCSDAVGAVLSGDSNAQRCCLVLQRVLGKSTSPASLAALANAKEFPVLLDPADNSKRLECARILADVPCSGDGTARKNAQVWRSWNRKEALELHSLQRNILVRALHLLPPGGLLVYSTCSLNPLENEAVVLCALRKWYGRDDGGVELLDTPAACLQACEMQPSPGLTKWIVPAPGRGSPLFTSFNEVPEHLRQAAGGLLRPEMFALRDGNEADPILTPLLRRCARFYPHHGNTGGFFMAMLRKVAPTIESIPSPLLPKTTDGAAGNGRDHPLLISKFTRVRATDPAWIELSKYFGIEPAWAEDKLRRGLLFWRALHGRDPEGLSLASEGTARIFDAPVGTGRALPWVRVGAAMFEHLPKGFLTGSIAPTRWRIASEGAAMLVQVVRCRQVKLLPQEMLTLLRSENKQSLLMDLHGSTLDGNRLDQEESTHACGGILVRVEGFGLQHIAVPGALTPRLLRLLVDKDAAEALDDLLSEWMIRSSCRNGLGPVTPHAVDCRGVCWAGLAAAAHLARCCTGFTK